MLSVENLTNLRINTDILEKITNYITSKEVELIICQNSEIQEYNRIYRGVNRPTDVLSFPLLDNIPNTPLGSIIISVDFIIEKSKEFKHSTDDELSLLLIHGLLHLIGYDHEIDNGEMRKKEEEIIYKFNLPKSLIVRTEGI